MGLSTPLYDSPWETILTLQGTRRVLAGVVVSVSRAVYSQQNHTALGRLTKV